MTRHTGNKTSLYVIVELIVLADAYSKRVACQMHVVMKLSSENPAVTDSIANARKLSKGGACSEAAPNFPLYRQNGDQTSMHKQDACCCSNSCLWVRAEA